MAYESTEEPGRKFQNIQHGKTFDRVRKEEKSSKKSKPKEKASEEHEQDIHESVAEHGPVHKIEMHSHHEDGHVHRSEHHDAQTAHEHVDGAMGHMEPDGDEAEAMPMAGGPGAAPPGM